jgi:sirohydrochlorin ferrochelatase
MVVAPPLVAAAHGTRDAAGREAIDALRAAVSAARRGLAVVEAYVDEDVQQPGLTEVVHALGRAVVVPLLLSAGYHVHVDVAAAVRQAGPGVVTSGPLGPDPTLATVVADRLTDAGAAGHAVVLAAAGSSDQRAVTDVARMAELVSERLGRSVVPAFATAGRPAIADAVAELRAAGERVAVAAYVLAPGHFHDRIRTVGAAVVTAPLLPHPAVVDLVLRRYDEALVRAG